MFSSSFSRHSIKQHLLVISLELLTPDMSHKHLLSLSPTRPGDHREETTLSYSQRSVISEPTNTEAKLTLDLLSSGSLFCRKLTKSMKENTIFTILSLEDLDVKMFLVLEIQSFFKFLLLNLQMERSETLCRYCGVSYLVYHEFHQLNTRLSQLQAELQDVRAAADGEKARREAVELSRTERERKLELQMLKEKNLKEELEKETRNKENLLREEFERKRREMEEQHHKTSGEKEEQLRRELRDLEEDKLKRQREELERRWEEREDRLSDALQQANETLDEQKKYVQQLEHR